MEHPVPPFTSLLLRALSSGAPFVTSHCGWMPHLRQWIRAQTAAFGWSSMRVLRSCRLSVAEQMLEGSK